MNKFFIFTSALLLFSGSIAHSVDIFYEISQKKLSENTQKWLKSSECKTMINDKGQTILHHAVLSGNIKIIKKVANSNVDINALDKAGKTALDYAVDHGNKNVIVHLLNKKASVTTQENVIFIKNLLEQTSCFSQITSAARKIFIIGAITLAIGIVICLSACFISFTAVGMGVPYGTGNFHIGGLFAIPGIFAMGLSAPVVLLDITAITK
ncbi:MAG TPA: ankyrin repeat domain-containing protein [Candidatus Saccharimonadales bacterium]|nr:ankyrin repeat domain-containing protein [Candidatus Saccharimonadales bacterium]